ncbi:PREDICTED: protein CLP1 homolog isoform X1 [Vollenhovia emeryi]|uniref:protein CLP1 homolog isoform X1 n=1 Tax=Vollenhovia emeryi TaxID=411798 RepID=UPI0005F460AD|nr:PREDICTED: protein CLP1 homolog isoform X1 [Vollenhovia emeryi]
MAGAESVVQRFKLDPDCELRFEVKSKNKVTLELISGLAEVFGTELVQGKKYEFTTEANIAVYAPWHDCVVELVGLPGSSYMAKNTPMRIYLNCHEVLERMRQTAAYKDTVGPVTMVVGSHNVGKSTLCKILLNHAVRKNRRPIFVDLDVSQGHISVPGTISALLMEHTSDVVKGFSQKVPVVFHFGHKTPHANVMLYRLLVMQLATICKAKLQADYKKAKVSGIVINTFGCIKKDDYSLLAHAVEEFKVDTILVLDEESLYYELVKDLSDLVKVIILPMSDGVVERSQDQRTEANNQSIKKFFYGSQILLYSHSFVFNWSDIKLYKYGAPVPTCCAPLDKARDNPTKLVPVALGPHLLHRLLSVSFTDNPETVLRTTISGFVCVTDVNVEKQTLTLLASQSTSLLNKALILSDIEFIASNYEPHIK